MREQACRFGDSSQPRLRLQRRGIVSATWGPGSGDAPRPVRGSVGCATYLAAPSERDLCRSPSSAMKDARGRSLPGCRDHARGSRSPPRTGQRAHRADCHCAGSKRTLVRIETLRNVSEESRGAVQAAHEARGVQFLEPGEGSGPGIRVPDDLAAPAIRRHVPGRPTPKVGRQRSED